MPDPILHNLDVRPKSSDVYLWCDYIEVRCLAHPDHRFSRGDLLELLDETVELAIAVADLDDGLDADDDDDLDSDEAEADEDGAAAVDTEPVAAGKRGLTLKDRNEAKTADFFKNLAYRASIFSDAYPFEMDASGQELRLRDIGPPLRKLYLQLLLSATLRLVPKTRRHELTEPFEVLCTKIFSCLMPVGWEVHRFGAKGSTRYKGHLYTRLKKLADDLRGQLRDVERRHFKTTNAGDGGLDIVAWHPLGNDTRVGIPIALAQCGCTAEEWTLKSLEASPAALGGVLTTQHDWATYYFMPQDLVDGQGTKQDWQRRPSLTRCIVIDRMRLIRLANAYGVGAECANAAERVVEASELAIK
jgi:hypothetical protein